MKRASLVLLLAAACSAPAQRTPDPLPNRGLAVAPPDKSVFLRASFDDDPSDLIGRFLPDALSPAEIDETRAARTRCSQFLAFKVVNASGTFDETFNSARDVSASLGVKPVAGASAAAGDSQALRVRYQLKKKMRADIRDPEGLARCCDESPESCAGRYVGEFFYGTGEVYQAAGSKAEIEASGIYKAATGDFDFKDEIAWKRVNKFEDVYFAFRTSAARIEGNAQIPDDCSWADAVPRSPEGTFFVGVNTPAASEAQARDLAMRNARAQVVKWLGEYVKEESRTKASSLDGVLEDEQVVTAAAEGLASRVKDRRWCPAQTAETPRGQAYTVKVLAFFPEAEKQAAAKEAVEAMATATKDPAAKRELKALASGLP